MNKSFLLKINYVVMREVIRKNYPKNKKAIPISKEICYNSVMDDYGGDVNEVKIQYSVE